MLSPRFILPPPIFEAPIPGKIFDPQLAPAQEYPSVARQDSGGRQIPGCFFCYNKGVGYMMGVS